MSNARKAVWVAVWALISLALSGLWWGVAQTHDIRLSQAQIQGKIDDKFTPEKPYIVDQTLLDTQMKKHHLKLLRLREITAHSATVDLTTDHLIGMHVVMSAKALSKTRYDVNGSTAGQIEFHRTGLFGGGEFFLHPTDVTVNEVLINGKSISEKVTGLITKFAHPQYLLNLSDDIGEFVQEKTDNGLQRAVTIALDRIPVYRLKDDLKGKIIGASLQKIDVQNGYVVATVSFWQLTNSVLTLIGIVFVCLVFAGLLIMAGPDFLPILLFEVSRVRSR